MDHSLVVCSPCTMFAGIILYSMYFCYSINCNTVKWYYIFCAMAYITVVSVARCRDLHVADTHNSIAATKQL